MAYSKNIRSKKWIVICIFILILSVAICVEAYTSFSVSPPKSTCLRQSDLGSSLIYPSFFQESESFSNKATARSDQIQAEKAGVSESTLYGTYGKGGETTQAVSTALDPTFNSRSPTTYDTNNYDVLYHTDPETLQKTDMHSPLNGTWVNQDGKAVFVPWKTESKDFTYYKGGAYPYGGTSYVPTYEETVYLSKTTRQSTLANSYNKADIMSGFCAQPGSIETNCSALTANQCASTTCCVLLGGSKCVGGDANGPTLASNYSDVQIHNKDFYYYQGKCYGNCDNTNHSGTPYPRKPT